MVSPTGPNDGSVDIDVRIKADEKELNKTQRMLENFKKTLGDATTPQRARELQNLAKEFASLRAKGLDAGHAALQLRNRLKEISATKSEISTVTAEYNRLNKAIVDTRKEAQVTAKAAAQAAKEAAKAAEEAAKAAALEAEANTPAALRAKRGEALNKLGREARLSLPSFPIPGTPISTDFVGRIAEVSGKLGLNMKDLVIAGGAATVAIIGITLAMKNFENVLQPISVLLKGIIEGRAAAAGILASQGPGGIVAETEQRRTALADQQARRDQLQTDIEGMSAQLEKELPDIGELVRAALTIPSPDLAFLTEEILAPIAARLGTTVGAGPLGEAITEFNTLNGTIAQNQAEIAELNKVYLENLELVRRAEAAQREIAVRTQFDPTAGGTAESARSRLDAINAERTAIQQVIETSDLGTDALNEFMEQFNLLGEEFITIMGLLPRLEDIERIKKAEEDRLSALNDLNSLSQQVVDTQAQGQERLAALAEQSAKQLEAAEGKLLDAVTKLADFEDDTGEKRAELQSSFMKSELERTTKFNKDLEKSKEDSNRRLLELSQRLEDDQFDAELNNSVAQFIEAQRKFDREAEQEKAGLDVVQQRKLEDFQTEARRSQELLGEKIAALDKEAAKKRDVLLAEIAEQEAALQTTKNQIAQKQQAEEAALKASLAALVQNFDTSTQAITQTGVQAMQILQNAGIDVARGIVAEMQRAAGVSYTSGSSIMSGQPSTARIALAPRIAPLVKLTGFGEGGRITRPTWALMGEDPLRDDWLFPVKKSEGIEAALAKLGMNGGGRSVVVNYIHNGDITDPKVTVGQLRQAFDQFANEQGSAIAAVRYGR